MRAWPLVFTYHGVIKGAGFSALVNIVSRVLAEERESDMWLDGAQPGGFAVKCDDLGSARKVLRNEFHDILRDLADEADDFDAFEEALQRFYDDIDNKVHALWSERWRASQCGQLDCGPADHMPRLRGEDTRTKVDVLELQPAAVGASVPRQAHVIHAVAA